MSTNPQDDIGDKTTAFTRGGDRKEVEEPVWDFSLLPGRPPRPAAHVRFDLELALAYKERYQHRAAVDRWVQAMSDDNEADIARLQVELERAIEHESPTAAIPSGPARPGEETADDDLAVEGRESVRWPRRQSRHRGPGVGL